MLAPAPELEPAAPADARPDLGAAASALDPSSLIATFPGPALTLDPAGGVLAANPRGAALAAALTAERRGALAALVDDGRPRLDRIELPGAEGGLALQLVLLPLRGPGRQVLVLAADLTLERNLIAALTGSRQRFRDLVACSTDFAWETGADGRFAYVSPRGALGFSPWELEGRSAAELRADPADAMRQTLGEDAGRLLGDGAAARWPFDSHERLDDVETWLVRKDGSVGCFRVSCQPVRNAEGRWTGTRGVARDVTEARRRDVELRRMHSHLKRLARTDELTGLCNRRTLLEELDWRLAHQRRHRRCGALLYVDLDNFKAVNDCFGHGRGDALLRAFADRLGGAVRLGDLAARIGGDEFAVWLEEIDAAGAARVAERIAAFAPELDREHGAPDRSFGVSVGVAISDPEADETPTALLARADRAMYAAKARGKAVATAGSPQDGG